METSQSSIRASTSHIEFTTSNPMKVARPNTMQKFTPKTNLPMMANSRQAERSGAISRAGKHRWPQATMVVMGRTEREIINTEMLSVSTSSKSKLDNLKTTERSKNEKITDFKTFLPDIVPGGQANGHSQDSNQIPVRFAARSPSKLSQLPKGIVNPPHGGYEIKEEGKSKLIKSIKFWRGTTPTAKEFDDILDPDKVDEQHNSKHIAKSSEILTKQDSILQSWTEQSSVSEETGKNRYFSWHMALRERLLKHEKMHYHEAVARINKYRQRLKQRPGLMPSKELLPNMDVQIWKNLIQQHGEKKKPATVATNRQQPTLSMSPTQEWKPFILNENDTEKSQRRPPFFGKQASILNDAAKKHVKVNGTLQSSNKKGKISTSIEKPDTNYPVHGEGLLKGEFADSSNVLPCIIATSPPNHKKASKETKDDSTPDSEEIEDNEKNATRALLVDLKNQLRSKTDQKEEDLKDAPSRGATAPSQQPKTGLGAKLKLLLQNSAPAQQPKGENVRFSSTGAQQFRSKLQSQQNGYRPMSRPRTIGDGSLPKIHNIATPSPWKRQSSNKDGDLNVKHRLTLAGVANRESFSSSVIGIAQKHITNRPQQPDIKGKHKSRKTEEKKDNIKSKSDGKLSGKGPLEVTASKQQSNETVNADKTKRNDEKDAAQTDKTWKKKNPAFRLYTPATILQHQYGSSASASRMQENENPQYKSLKLITSTAGKQQSPPRTPLDHFNARQAALKGKTKPKAAAKHKVLRIAVVEPPLTAKERIQRQQQIEKNMKRLTFNPTHAAVNNFTRAILNSELDLRAPSSSPVDMFYRQDNQPIYEISTDAWETQKQGDGLLLSGTAYDRKHPEIQYRYKELPVNEADGLFPPKRPFNVDGLEVNGLHENANIKGSSAPKVKDLVDLQRLYHVMKKHGEAYTNGATYFFSQSPNHMVEGIAKQQVMKQHTNQKNLHKTPYYYYPYQGGDGQAQVLDDRGDAALYVVTGANTLNGSRKLGHIQPPRVRYSSSEDDIRPKNASVPFRHVLTLNKNTLPHWEQSHRQSKASSSQDFQQTSKHALTVMMPKTPGITTSLPIPQKHPPLEQIQEHVIQ